MPTDPFKTHDAGAGLGDGRGGAFFTILEPEFLLIDAFETLIRARKTALQNVDPVEGKARAAAITLVIDEVSIAVNDAAAATAIEAEKFIVSRIKGTQKRPDPIGGKLTRLQDAILCEPVPTIIPGGAVGIARMDILNLAADQQGRAYWRAQEFGSHHLVGKTIYGLFQPGDAAPDPAQSRVHPIFQVDPAGKGMKITNPIEERAFLREGAALAEFFRQKELGNAVATGFAGLQAVIDGSFGSLPALRRIVK